MFRLGVKYSLTLLMHRVQYIFLKLGLSNFLYEQDEI